MTRQPVPATPNPTFTRRAGFFVLSGGIADQRHTEPVGIGMEVTESRTFGTDMPLRPDIIAIRANQLHLIVLNMEFKATHRLA